MATKFYAVKNGRTPGIYLTWSECESQVKNFPNAIYKSFKTKDEADAFINNTAQPAASNIISDITTYETPYAFVDGSFNISTNTYGFGGFLIDNNNNKHVLQGSGNDPDMASMRNVAGEILGSMAAISKAIDLKLDNINIYYDYAGIEQWATGTWKRNKNGTIAYHNFIKENKNKININFIKVAAHTGIPGNEEADQLAKQAVGI